MKRKNSIGWIIFFVGLGAIIFFGRGVNAPVTSNEDVEPGSIIHDLDGSATADWDSYRSARFGFAFKYSGSYFLEEQELGNGERYHSAIILTDDTEENRMVREGKAPGREGPVAITFDVYQNNLDNRSLREWLEATSFSNYKLGDGTSNTITLAGKTAIFYRWSGLYEAETVAFEHGDNIIAATVTYIAPEDSIRRDFMQILGTIEFQK